MFAFKVIAKCGVADMQVWCSWVEISCIWLECSSFSNVKVGPKDDGSRVENSNSYNGNLLDIGLFFILTHSSEKLPSPLSLHFFQRIKTSRHHICASFFSNFSSSTLTLKSTISYQIKKSLVVLRFWLAEGALSKSLLPFAWRQKLLPMNLWKRQIVETKNNFCSNIKPVSSNIDCEDRRGTSWKNTYQNKG